MEVRNSLYLELRMGVRVNILSEDRNKVLYTLSENRNKG